jgi:hypothetical protein
MMTNPFRSVALFVLLLCGTVVSAQQKSLNYGFVSPNTKENLKLEEAIKGMHAPEETRLIKQSINLGCVVRSRIRAFRALGSWSDGAVQSVMLRVESDEPTVRYLMSRLGRDAQQKSILYFHPQPAGTAYLYTLKPRIGTRNLTALANTLERAGIAFRTLVPVGSNTWIYVVDPNRELRAKVMVAARRLRAQVRSEPGSATFVGAELSQLAKVVFEQEIRIYEAKHPNLPPTCDTRSRRRN